jgi:hypothetical protein
MIKLAALCALMIGMAFSIEAQTIDTSLLPDLVPGRNACYGSVPKRALPLRGALVAPEAVRRN